MIHSPLVLLAETLGPPSSQLQAQSGVELTVLGSWSLPKEGQEDLESFLRDLSTIFPQEPWLQISRTVGKMGFSCEVLGRDHSENQDLRFSVSGRHHMIYYSIKRFRHKLIPDCCLAQVDE